ncbi:MAG: STAS domain-containing protein [Calditrichaeota bacterium]|nr:STAS domain-containing protein [Calditrichota bacterium]MCB0303265.1 STAS domain-containing protein [Calditrichota bacterium]
MFRIEEDARGKMASLKLSGIMIDTDAMALNDRVRQLIGQGKKQIVFDLSEVRLMNSCFGLGILMACWSCLNRAGGELKLASPSAKVLHLLEITKLDQIFDIFDTVTEAKSSFGEELPV